MNNIYANVDYSNSVINNQTSIYGKNLGTQPQEISMEEKKCSDSIEISEKDKDTINTKKAYDAFKDTCSDFGYMETSTGGGADMSLWYGIVIDQMEDKGIYVPSFVLSDKNSTSSGFVNFMDKIKDFAQNMVQENPGVLPDNFGDFCDAYKQKLIQYGCY